MNNRFGLSTESIQKIVGVLKRHTNVAQAIIYGSRAKGNFKPNSDIDLTLIDEPHLDSRELAALELELDDLLLPQKIDLSLLREIESKDLIDHIERVGQTLYSR